MAMLAEPRQRKRYNLVPRGKALYEDDSRYGTKMLEKMGWSKGHGLGAKQDGSKDFVRIRYKNDQQGLGFEHRDDQWTGHEENFNGLLSKLNGGDDETATSKQNIKTNEASDNGDDDVAPRMGFGFQQQQQPQYGVVDSVPKPKKEKLKEKISGISLEERSKQSRARVHYKKFTKGKDLSQYSEKDLANIFGKKADKEDDDFYSQLNIESAENNTEKKADQDDTEEQKNFAGVQTISTGVSVADYFKLKMEALKNKKSNTNNVNGDTSQESETKAASDSNSIKKKKKSKKSSKEEVSSHDIKENVTTETDGFSLQNSDIDDSASNTNKANGDTSQESEIKAASDSNSLKRKNKSKKSSKEVVPSHDINQNVTNETEQFSLQNSTNSEIIDLDNSASNTNNANGDTSQESEIKAASESNSLKRKKKSKKSFKEEVPSHDIKEYVTNETEQFYLQNSTNCEIIDLDDYAENCADKDVKRKKKKSKNNAKEVTVVLDNSFSTPEEEANLHDDEPIKKKIKKSKKDKKNTTFKEPTISSSSNHNTNDIHTQKKNDVSDTVPVVRDTYSLQNITNRYKQFNVYTISSFCAEKFRNLDLDIFKGSTLAQIEGYSIDPEIELNVKIIKADEERITNLWKSTLDKYANLEQPKKTYRGYVKDVIKARKTKTKRPKLNVKTWKRKSAFSAI